ncbi:hypothetical protein ACHAWX_007171 [Stephanocyclus meneghinianus]
MFRHKPDSGNYVPGLYIPNSEWEPEKASQQVEGCLKKFESKLHQQQKQFQRCYTPPNTTPLQASALSQLRNHNKFIIVPSDKNLGFTILEREIYIQRVLSDHLQKGQTYKTLTELEATAKKRELQYRFEEYLSKYFPSTEEDEDPDPIAIFLRRCYRRDKPNIAQFRATVKVHKQPWQLRPVVAKIGTYIEGLSKWLDKQLFGLTTHVPTIVRDSQQLRDKLVELQLPPNARLFTADAVSMYQNIDITHGIQVMTLYTNYLRSHRLLPLGFPTSAVIDGLKIVMRYNIFMFGDTHFLQLIGTAMGTSVAVVYANLYFGWHEINKILPRFQVELKRLNHPHRFIDDFLGVWLGPTDEQWQELKNTFNNFGLLKWEFEEPSHEVTYLDLTITLKNGRISTKTYQKPMNLYLYIPPHSAHPPGMIRGMVYGLLRHYYEQNSEREDFLLIMSLLFKRLIWRGWDKRFLHKLFISSYERIKTKAPSRAELAGTLTNLNSHRERLFFHLEYHPSDIPRRQIRQIYEEECQDILQSKIGISEFTIAYSRPSNVADMVSKSKLFQVEGKAVSYYIGEAST